MATVGGLAGTVQELVLLDSLYANMPQLIMMWIVLVSYVHFIELKILSKSKVRNPDFPVFPESLGKAQLPKAFSLGI